jgi:hypothetical protein
MKGTGLVDAKGATALTGHYRQRPDPHCEYGIGPSSVFRCFYYAAGYPKNAAMGLTLFSSPSLATGPDVGS